MAEDVEGVYHLEVSWAQCLLVRLGFAASRRQARQLIRHGHWTVNGRRVNIPSYQVRPGEVIAIKAGTAATQVVRDATELTGQIPAWLQADHESLTAKVRNDLVRVLGRSTLDHLLVLASDFDTLEFVFLERVEDAVRTAIDELTTAGRKAA